MQLDILVIDRDGKSRVVPVGRHGATIGSGPRCDIPVEGALAEQARVGFSGRALMLTRLDTAAPIHVNGQSVAEATIRLRHRDKITVAGTRLEVYCPELGTFITYDHTADTPSVLDFQRGPRIDREATPPPRGARNRAWMFESGRFGAVNPVADKPLDQALESGKVQKLKSQHQQAHEDLLTVYRISNVVHRHALDHDLFDRIVESVREAVPADRWALLLWLDGAPVPVVLVHGTADVKDQPPPIYNEAVVRSARERLSLSTVWTDENEPADEGGPRPVTCVPLGRRHETTGVLYADRLPGSPLFSDRELALLSAVGRQAGHAIATHDLFRKMRHQEFRLREAQQDQLVARERLLEGLLASMSDGVVIFDQHGELRVLNAAARRILGYGGPDDAARLREWLRESPLDWMADEQKPVPPEASRGLQVRMSLPVERALRVTAAAGDRTLADGPHPGGRIILLEDRTEEEITREQLLHSEKLSTLGELVAGIAHELNNPLAVVLGFAQLLEAGKIEPASAVKPIAEAARRAKSTVRSLLTFARAPASERTPVDLNDIITSSAELLAYQLRTSNVKLTLNLDPGLPNVSADPQQLSQVFVNLINNARQAIAGAGEDGRIDISTMHAGGQIVARVADDGPGIPEAVAKRIFEPFYTTKPPGEGTGLGLSVSWSVIREAGGTLEVEERPEGMGATFVVKLPKARPETESGIMKAIVSDDAAVALQGVRAVVIDDESPVLNLIVRTLESRGVRIVLATTEAEKGLDAALRERPDVVLTDCKMPKLSGPQLLERISAKDADLGRRVILITGDTTNADLTALAARRGVPVLAKPFQLDDLERTVIETVRKSQKAPS